MWIRTLRVAGAATLILVPACADIARDHVADLLRRPAVYDGKTVTVRGEVVSVIKVPLIDTKMYRIREDSAEIPIITEGELPQVGTHVSVHGQFSTVAMLDAQSFGPHITVTPTTKP